MFDIGFFELVIIAVIALLVLGPERLPHAVRMTGAWIGKFRRAAHSVREEIEREVNAYEMQQRIKEQMEKSGLGDTKEILEETKKTLRNGILDEQTLKEIEKRGLTEYAKSLTEPKETESASAQSDSTENTNNSAAVAAPSQIPPTAAETKTSVSEQATEQRPSQQPQPSSSEKSS